MLDDFGLAPALKALGAALEEQGGPEVKLKVEHATAERLPARVETALYRITQEALTNVVKHADAKTVRITFVRHERSVVLTIDDDGCGFTRAQVPGDGFGLVGMRERTASVNGALEIESRPGTGTRLMVEIRSPESAAPPASEAAHTRTTRQRSRRVRRGERTGWTHLRARDA